MRKKRKAGKPMTRAWLERQIDLLHPVYIRNRDSNTCVVCGSIESPTCGHIFSRRALSTRWDVAEDGNCHCQCWACNFVHGGTGLRGPKDKWPYFNWYIKKFGVEKLDELHLRTNKPKHWTIDELLELYEFLNERVPEHLRLR